MSLHSNIFSDKSNNVKLVLLKKSLNKYVAQLNFYNLNGPTKNQENSVSHNREPQVQVNTREKKEEMKNTLKDKFNYF